MVDPNKDYYKILQISEKASNIEIRKAFFNLAKKYHPDLNSDKRQEDRENAKIKFQEINEAHQILTDQQMKQYYDLIIKKNKFVDPQDQDEKNQESHKYQNTQFRQTRQVFEEMVNKAYERVYKSQKSNKYEEKNDLDSQLKNLQKIKELREQELKYQRDQQKYKLFFSIEMAKLKQKQLQNQSRYAFYKDQSKDHVRNSYKTIIGFQPDTQDNQQNQQDQQVHSLQEREYMIKPNNMEYFYEENERSERVFEYHRKLNRIWSFASKFTIAFLCIAYIYSRKQKQDMWTAAEEVVSKVIKRGGESKVLSDGSIQVTVDGLIIDVIPKNIIQVKQINDLIKNQDIELTLRQAIAYMVMQQTSSQPDSQFLFYNSIIKPDLKNLSPSLYSKYITNQNLSKLTFSPYGVFQRSNKAQQVEISRDPQSQFSIFDDAFFKFYVVKYCEVLGAEALMGLLYEQKGEQIGLSHSKKISYYQKIRMIDYICKTERSLGVEESSWRHCLLYMFLNGVISEEDFKSQFIFNQSEPFISIYSKD